jgi:glycosyltransferase involved in cell wall biosynthesis
MKLSIVVCVYNEEENIVPLIEAVHQSLKDYDYELIYVDDGSTDGTVKTIKSAVSKRVILIELKKNYGQSAALAAGIDFAKGDFIVTMDGDLQNDPKDIPAMLKIMEEEDLDVVAGMRDKRKDKFINRVFPSIIANWMIRKSTGLKTKDFGCSLRVFRAKVAKDLGLYGELHRFIPVLLHLQGATVKQIPVAHRARVAGKSKYGIKRSIKVVSDLTLMLFFNKYLQRPMQLFGTLGIFMFLIGAALNIYLLVLKILGQDIWGKPLLILAVITLIGGIQLITIGIIAELLMRTYYESQDKKHYIIKKITKGEN